MSSLQQLLATLLWPQPSNKIMKQLLLLLLSLGSVSLVACQDTGQTNEVKDASSVTLSITGMT